MEGVGASQVLPYAEGLARKGLPVILHTFEKATPSSAVAERLRTAGVTWKPHPFGRFGPLGGALRILRGAYLIRDAELVHARSDLAAASALIARPDRWLWDSRSFYADQKIELGELRRGSVEEKLLRIVEQRSAEKAFAIVTLTSAAKPVLAERFGQHVLAKCHVVTTCVDIERFQPKPLPPVDPLTFFLAGSVNRYYDVPLMVALVKRASRDRHVAFHLASQNATAWEIELEQAVTRRFSLQPDQVPNVISMCHVGLSVCREDAGISLTGSMPTKIAEFLASGRPVVVNPSLGDAAQIVTEHDCGVVLRGQSPDDLDRAVIEIEELLADEETPERCRAVAETHFNLERAVDALLGIYRDV
jgi:glycosyltransferase involved in cell wall biosynthesis